MGLISTEQCAIPVFDHLFPKAHHEILMDLLFELATWHALAKLRLHTESTIVALEHSTRCLGKAIRIFEGKLCNEYTAHELPGEDAPQAKGKVKAAEADQGAKDSMNKQAGSTEPAAKKKKKIRYLNLKTYKLHALGHYAQAI